MGDRRRRSFGPVVLVGLAAAGLAAVAGNRAWVRPAAEHEVTSSMLTSTGAGSATVPLAGALALVLLACWGVILVTRARLRRAVAGLGLLVSLAMAVTGVLGHRTAVDALHADLAEVGLDELATRSVAWFWVYLASVVACLVATAAAFRLVPSWPEMGSRYDTPGIGGPTRDEGQSDLDLWRAMDEGRDPTLTDRHAADP
jgi:Tryptophan-associated transmembrane protein (Trp_oprn_chp)